PIAKSTCTSTGTAVVPRSAAHCIVAATGSLDCETRAATSSTEAARGDPSENDRVSQFAKPDRFINTPRGVFNDSNTPRGMFGDSRHEGLLPAVLLRSCAPATRRPASFDRAVRPSRDPARALGRACFMSPQGGGNTDRADCADHFQYVAGSRPARV